MIPGFWARRVRRILPAALIAAVLRAGDVVLVPPDSWATWLSDIQASALYVQNWQLAADAVDYFAADDAPSPVQHFWSLSVEEQFYLVWPVCCWCSPPGRAPAGRGYWWGLMLAVLRAASPTRSTSPRPIRRRPTSSRSTRAWEFGAEGCWR